MYCVGCRGKKNVNDNLVDKEINTKNGRMISMTCGTCPTCKGKVCTITGNKMSSSNRYSVKSKKRSTKRSAKRSAKSSAKSAKSAMSAKRSAKSARRSARLAKSSAKRSAKSAKRSSR
jgi:hypothetical protein